MKVKIKNAFYKTLNKYLIVGTHTHTHTTLSDRMLAGVGKRVHTTEIE